MQQFVTLGENTSSPGDVMSLA